MRVLASRMGMSRTAADETCSRVSSNSNLGPMRHKKSYLLGILCWSVLTGAVVEGQNQNAPQATSGAVWVQTFNTFDPKANNIVITLQSGDWVQSISYVRKLEISGSMIRFTYGKDSRRMFRGVVNASAVKMIVETSLTN